MIKSVSFSGKAFFLDNVLKTIPQDHKQRIEKYAEKCEEDANVIVIGRKKETVYEYDGTTYNNDNVVYNTVNHTYRFKTDKGFRTVTPDKVKISDIPVSVYNAYIVYGFNTENVKLGHYMKEFDFRHGAKSKIIGCNYKERDDMPF